MMFNLPVSWAVEEVQDPDDKAGNGFTIVIRKTGASRHVDDEQTDDGYSQIYDFNDYYGTPKKVVCLYFMPRSGTNYLAREMSKTGVMGYPLEYFSPDHILDLKHRMNGFGIGNINPLLQRRTSPNGVFSFKWNSNFGDVRQLGLKPDRSIFVDRQDTVAQARSFCIAEKTGGWAIKKNSTYAPSKQQIQDAMQKIAAMRDSTLRMIPTDHLKIDYEAIQLSVEKTVTIISEYILGAK
jgi:LPS sulfotransferase NodH